MAQTREALTTPLAERWCWQVARRDEARVARRLDRTPVVDGVYRLDEGALWDDFVHVRQERGGVDVWERVRGTALEREWGPLGRIACAMGCSPGAAWRACMRCRRCGAALRP